MENEFEISSIEIGNRIKGLLNIFHIPRVKLAQEMNISYNTLTKKLNGKIDFSYKDFKVIKKVFNLSYGSCGNIFFNPLFLVEKQKFIN